MGTRRKFFKQAAGISITCSGMGLISALEGCVSIRYANVEMDGNTMKISKAEFLMDKSIMLSSDKLQAPVLLYTHALEEYKAIYLLCTHKGCDVKPAGAILACPCHGSEFTRSGKVLAGPAEQDLWEFPVSLEGENILVNINL